MTSSYSIGLTGVQEMLTNSILNPVQRAKVLQQGLRLGGTVLETGLKRHMPVRTGQTRSRVTGRLSLSGSGSMSWVVGLKSIANGFDIARALEEGTGLFGPKAQRIYPKTAKALRWYVGARAVSGTGGKAIFRRSVAGMKPRRPFARTIAEEGPFAVQAFRRSVASSLVRAAHSAI